MAIVSSLMHRVQQLSIENKAKETKNDMLLFCNGGGGGDGEQFDELQVRAEQVVAAGNVHIVLL